jgi:SAM-dependent methyltransferase
VDRLDVLYRHRFSPDARRARDRIWEVLCTDFFQRYVGPEDTVLDLGCGFGEFSRFIRARRKIAVDLNPDAAAALPPGVEFHAADARTLPFVPPDTVDVCFTSNFFEHLGSKQDLDALLGEVLRVLRPGGRLVALQPNIKYAPGDYWDFYDHHLPLSHLSCAEAFAKAGFGVDELIGRFLPFTTCSPLPQSPWLVRLYLRVRPAWRVLGRQFLIVGRKPAGSLPRA